MKRIGELFFGLALILALTGCGRRSESALPPVSLAPTPGPIAGSPAIPETSPAAGPAEGIMEVHYIDVGQADSSLILCGGESMLVDGGNVADSDLVVAYLAEHGVEELDYVVCTHAHEDHVGGLAGGLEPVSGGRGPGPSPFL